MKTKLFLTAIILFGFNFLRAQVPSYVPTNGLLGYWSFTGNANDTSGNNYNGTVTGATLTTDRFGNTNSAYYFNGNSKIVCNTSNLPISNNSRTISTWIKWDSSQAIWDNRIVNYGSCPVFSNSGSFGLIIWDVSGNGNPVNADVHVYGCGAGDLDSNIHLDTNWHHLIGTYNGVASSIYIDGILIMTANRTINTILSQLVIGANEDLSQTNGNFKGTIDDVGIWNRALTTNEISNLFNGGICYQNVTVTDILVINTGILSYNPVTYNNTITIYPNPANDHITIDCGNIANIVGYHIEISNALGQILFNQPMNTQQYNVALNSWTGQGVYFVKVYDAQNNLLTTRKIILQ